MSNTILTGRDKLYHIIACAIITCLAFLALAIALELYMKIRTRREENNGEIENNDDDDDDVEIASAAAQNMDNTKNFSPCAFRRQCPKEYFIIAGISGIVAIAIGIAKEIGDVYNVWPPCQTPVGCHASWGDMLANFIGVLLGEMFIVVFLWLKTLIIHDDRSSTQQSESEAG